MSEYIEISQTWATIYIESNSSFWRVAYNEELASDLEYFSGVVEFRFQTQ